MECGLTGGCMCVQYFEQKLQAMVLPGNQNNISKKMVVWEELFENGVSLRSIAPPSVLCSLFFVLPFF
jgi:hypothetical protein